MNELLAGKYELLRPLARGGMAEVHLARQVGEGGFEKLVVIKQILPHYSDHPAFVEMFLEEARLAADLRHPNVVQLYEVGKAGDTYFIAMELLRGATLSELMQEAHRRRIHIAPRVASRVVLDAAAALHYAHHKKSLRGERLGIIHRDVSPQNLFVTDAGITKLLDFGIAKAAASTPTTSGALKGKYAYMSPEQADGEALDQSTDQFALAVVLHELLCGKPLFRRGQDMATLKAVRACEVPSVLEVHPELAPTLDEVLRRALHKEAGERFPDCAAFGAALEVALPPASLNTVGLVVDNLGQESSSGAFLVDRGKRERALLAADGAATAASPLRDRLGGAPAIHDQNTPSEVSTRPLDEAEEGGTDIEAAALADTEVSGRRSAPGGAPTTPGRSSARPPTSALDEQSTEVALEQAGLASRRGWLALAATAAAVVALALWQVGGAVPSPDEGQDGTAEGPPSDLNTPDDPSGWDIQTRVPEPGPPTLEPAEKDPPRARRRRRARPRRRRRAPPVQERKPPAEDPAPEPDPEPAARRPEGTGVLRLPDGDPYWLVTLDGKSRGSTPILKLKVPAGEHTLVLESPDHKQRFQRQLSLTDGQRLNIRVQNGRLVVR